jgi:hypothetical protein
LFRCGLGRFLILPRVIMTRTMGLVHKSLHRLPDVVTLSVPGVHGYAAAARCAVSERLSHA